MFADIGLSPNQFTLLSIVLAILTSYLLAKQNFLASFICFLGTAFLDLVDGAVARRKNMVSKKGAYLDTITDRIVEIIVLFGFLLLPLEKIVLFPYAWVFLAMAGGLITTYAKSAAGEKDVVEEEMKAGFLGRTERMIGIGLAILLGTYDISLVIAPIIVLAVFSNITAIQRILLAFTSAES